MPVDKVFISAVEYTNTHLSNKLKLYANQGKADDQNALLFFYTEGSLLINFLNYIQATQYNYLHI